MGITWTDLALPGRAPKPSHVTTLRAAVQPYLTGVDPTFNWGWDPSDVGAGQPIRALYPATLRDAIQKLWDSKGRGPLPMWSSGVHPGGPSNPARQDPTPIYASDITDLRRWLNQYIDNHPAQQQGIDTKSYDPGDSRKPVIQGNWADDIKALSNDKPLWVRCKVIAPNDGGSDFDYPTDLDRFRDAFRLYRAVTYPNPHQAEKIKIYAIFARDLYNPVDQSPEAPLNLQNGLSNAYIEGFSDRAAVVAANFFNDATARVEDFIIWNEPNAESPLSPERLAPLLRWCRQKMPAGVNVYWGGLQFGEGFDPHPRAYIDAVYQWFYTNLLAVDVDGNPQPGFGWPWSGINLHLHNDTRSAAEIAQIFVDVRAKLAGQSDPGVIIVGEWGVKLEDYVGEPGHLSSLFNNIRVNNPDVMFFFAHHGVDDPHDINPKKHWGLRLADDAAQAVDGNPGQYVLLAKTALYDPYDNLIGT